MTTMGSDSDELQEEVDDLKERVSRLEALLEEDPEVADEVVDIQTFIQDFDPSTHAERAVGIAYFLEQHEGRESFKTSDIEEGYRRIRMSLPANMSDVLNSGEENEWIMREGQEGQTTIRRLTIDGINMVEEALEDGS